MEMRETTDETTDTTETTAQQTTTAKTEEITTAQTTTVKTEEPNTIAQITLVKTEESSIDVKVATGDILTTSTTKCDDKEGFVLRCRGLVWTATKKDVSDFFKDCSIKPDGIHFMQDPNGRPSGDCYVEFESAGDIDKGKAHNKEKLGTRYLELKQTTYSELKWLLSRKEGGAYDPNDAYVKLVGLPYTATNDDIIKFFEGFTIAKDSIIIGKNHDGRPSGDAFVEFTTSDQVEKAIAKTNEKMGTRYIVIFKSSKNEATSSNKALNKTQYSNSTRARGRGGYSVGVVRAAINHRGRRPGPYDRPSVIGGGAMNFGFEDPRKAALERSKTGFMIHMRGLPFQAVESDVREFFDPLTLVEIRILFDYDGRPKGASDVDFQTLQDAEKAMERNRQKMGTRYIELYLRTRSSRTFANSAPALILAPTPVVVYNNGFGGFNAGLGGVGFNAFNGYRGGFGGRGGRGGGYGYGNGGRW